MDASLNRCRIDDNNKTIAIKEFLFWCSEMANELEMREKMREREREKIMEKSGHTFGQRELGGLIVIAA